jgi:hypothetical protein
MVTVTDYALSSANAYSRDRSLINSAIAVRNSASHRGYRLNKGELAVRDQAWPAGFARLIVCR